MTCSDFAAKVGAYVDAELSPEEMCAVGDHARGCAACAAVGLDVAAGKRVVKIAGLRYAPSADFRHKIQSQVSARRSWNMKLWLVPAIAVAACALVAVVLQFQLVSHAREQRLQEVADLHVSALASANPVDVVSTDRHTVKPWFQGKLPFSFDLPDPATVPFPLLGGRVTYLAQSPAAQLIYQARQHRLSVFITQKKTGDPFLGGTVESDRTSFKVESWAQGGLRYFVVGDTGWDEIHKLADAMKGAVSGS